MSGYHRSPILSASHLAYICADSLWIAERDGSRPRRLSTDAATASAPRFSPDGSQIAFASNREGVTQVHVVRVEGGPPRVLTAEAAGAVPVGFRPNGRLIVRSRRRAHLRSWFELFEVPLEGGPLELLPVGRALGIDFDEDGDRAVLQLNRTELAHWKRYRGGTVGDVWIGSLARADFRRLIQLEAGPVQPVFARGRVYFLCDQDGIGNIWSCTREGGDLRQHTFGREHYVRSLAACAGELVFARAGDVFVLDLDSGEERRLELDTRPEGAALDRRFASAPDELHEIALAPDGRRIAAIVRGKLCWMEAWGVGARTLGRSRGVRYRLANWLALPAEPAAKSKAPKTARAELARELVVVSDEGGEERLEIYDVERGQREALLALGPVRRCAEIVPNPARRGFALTDAAGRLLVWDLAQGSEGRLIATGQHGALRDVAWSADGRWLAWIERESWLHSGGILRLCDTETGRTLVLNDEELLIHSPTFDPAGRLLYVLSERSFNPVLDGVQFGATVPEATRLYAFVLEQRGLSPFDPRFPDVVEDEDRAREKRLEALDEDEAERQKRAPRPVQVDADGLAERLVEFPDVAPGSYSDLCAVKDGVLYLEWKRSGMLDDDGDPEDRDEARALLCHFEIATGKRTVVHDAVSTFDVGGERTLILAKDAAFLLKTGEEPPEEPPRKGKNRGTGELDLERLRVEIEPAAEWRQMFDEAWRLQREHFWTPDLAGVDWEAARRRYLPLLERIATRAELSDLIWELLGELGTSHAYEIGGDYPATRRHPVGCLGADFTWDGRGWRVERVLAGDAWHPESAAPLAAPGVGVVAGDRLVSIDGLPLDARTEPAAGLVNRAGQYVEVGILTAAGEERRVFVRCLESEERLRYRDWVRENRRRVRSASNAQLGYLHVPDMGGRGLAEFFRAFRAESKYPGLVVDVRDNGGGFVSPILLDCLRRKVLGYDRPRHGRWSTYPPDAVRGPIVALCDQFAGSDGDMFCMAFRALGLGPLVGKRTWGGVIGIEIDDALADGTITTQPEFAFFANELGWSVENRGIEPDVEVELDPAAIAAGRDPQLERAIELAMAALAGAPVQDPVWLPPPPRGAPFSALPS